MDRDDEHSAHTDCRYASLDDSVIPDAENLKVTLERALPLVFEFDEKLNVVSEYYLGK